MSEQKSPAERLKSEVSAMQREISLLQDKVRLNTVRDTVEDTQTTINNLDQRIADLRARGYVFGKGIEAQAADFEEQWAKINPSITAEINKQASSLQNGMRSLELQMSQLSARVANVTAARPLASKLKSDIDALESKAQSAERSVNGMYDSLRSKAQTLSTQLNKVDWMLKELAESPIQLLATEAGIMAVKAVWAKEGKEKKGDP